MQSRALLLGGSVGLPVIYSDCVTTEGEFLSKIEALGVISIILLMPIVSLL